MNENFRTDAVPSKPFLSYVLMLLPQLFIFRFIRQFVVQLGLKNSSDVDFEPGFRFYYGKNIHAKHVSFGNTLFEDYADITIGEGTAFSKDNKVLTGTHDTFDRQLITLKPVVIGKNVWITTNCIILPGVKIGDNAVIGAGSVVTKDIPANSVAAGNPCKVIKHFDESQLITKIHQ